MLEVLSLAHLFLTKTKMNLDYRFPLFDVLLQGKLNPMLAANHADMNYRWRLEEQIVEPAKDSGLYSLSFVKWTHHKTEYYRQLLLSETFAYCNEMITLLHSENNIQIRRYYREMILDRHLTTCLQRLGEVITESGLKLNSLIQPTPEDTTDSLANCYVLHLLKVCIAKAYIEIQDVLADVVTMPQTETLLYSAYLQELPPVKTFLVKRTVNPQHKPKYEPDVKRETVKAVAVAATEDDGLPVDEFMLVNEAAKILKVNEKTIRRRLESGLIKGIKDKSRWLIDKTAFKEYLNDLKTTSK